MALRGELSAVACCAATCVAFATGTGAAGAQTEKVIPAASERERIGTGAWSYFGDPRAVYANGKVFVGWVTHDGRVQVARIGAHLMVRTIAWMGQDDHNNPSLHVMRDGRIAAFYAPHAPELVHRRKARRMYYRVTRRPYDIDKWSAPRTVPNVPGLPGYGQHGMAYPNPVQVRGRTWLFFRGGSYWPSLTTTRDMRQWTRPVNVVRSRPGHRPYVKYAPSRGDGVFMAFTRAHPNSLPTGIYFLRLSASGRVTRADWTRVGKVGSPVHYRRADVVYRYSRRHGRAWVMDVTATPKGAPMVLYFTGRGTRSVYWRARWDGRAWRHHRIMAPGYGLSTTGWYMGGASFDHEDPSVVYLARRPPAGGPMEIEAWSTSTERDGPWRRRLVTQGSKEDNWRPVSPRGYEGYDVFWWAGRYLNYKAFRASIFRGAPGEEVAPASLAALPPSAG
jgi:hypothetical protein